MPTYLVGLLLSAFFACNPGNNNDSSENIGENKSSNLILDQANLNIDEGKLDEAMILLDSALLKPGSKRNEAEIHAALGYCLVRKESYHLGLEHYLKSESIFRLLKDDLRTSEMQINAATCFKIVGIFDRAARNVISAKDYMLKNDSRKYELSLAYNLLGNIHKNIGSYKIAKDYYNKCLKIRLRIPDASLSAPINNLGLNFYEMGNYDSALTYFKKSKNIALHQKNNKKIGRSYLNLGKTSFKLNRLGEAKLNIDLAQNYFDSVNYKSGKIALLLLKSDYNFNKNINQSKEDAFSALELSNELGLKEEKLLALKKISSIYSKLGEMNNALKFSEEYNNLKDNRNIATISNKIYSYEMLSQLDVKNAEIELIEAQKKKTEEESKNRATQRNFFIIFCVFALGFLYLLYKRYLEKKRFVDEYFASETGVILKSGRKLAFGDIHRVETYRNDLVLFTADGKVTEKTTTLKSFIPSLPKLNFGQAQRGIVVNFANIENVLKTKFDYKGETINISVNHRDDFLERWELFLKSKKS